MSKLSQLNTKPFKAKNKIKSPLGGTVDTYALGAYAERCVGSSPTGGTKSQFGFKTNSDAYE
jgi:hypothetical protein